MLSTSPIRWTRPPGCAFTVSGAARSPPAMIPRNARRPARTLTRKIFPVKSSVFENRGTRRTIFSLLAHHRDTPVRALFLLSIPVGALLQREETRHEQRHLSDRSHRRRDRHPVVLRSEIADEPYLAPKQAGRCAAGFRHCSSRWALRSSV